MRIELHDTKSSAVLTALTQTRHASGTASLGMVLTLVVDVEEAEHHDALHAASAAAREHPCRIVTVIRRPGHTTRLDAEVRVGDDNTLGEIIVLRLYGQLRDQVDSIVLPMLLPDAPVLVWWPGIGPAIPSEDALGLLAQRRVTDAAASPRPSVALRTRSHGHTPGDTDFAWTRLTPWRTLLAAALDQPIDTLIGGTVSAERNNASGELLATWLEYRLGVPVQRKTSKGPGITGVQLTTRHGQITITRPDGRLAALVRTGQPDRAVALPRRTTDELLAEELRRLDPDDVYNETIKRVFGADPRESRRATTAGQRLVHREAPTRKSASARASEVADTPAARRGHRATAPTVAAAPVVGADTIDLSKTIEPPTPRTSTSSRRLDKRAEPSTAVVGAVATKKAVAKKTAAKKTIAKAVATKSVTAKKTAIKKAVAKKTAKQ
jgi:glucose-6-phosphate dehydrogenase assembly protein OpcA